MIKFTKHPPPHSAAGGRRRRSRSRSERRRERRDRDKDRERDRDKKRSRRDKERKEPKVKPEDIKIKEEPVDGEFGKYWTVLFWIFLDSFLTFDFEFDRCRIEARIKHQNDVKEFVDGECLCMCFWMYLVENLNK